MAKTLRHIDPEDMPRRPARVQLAVTPTVTLSNGERRSLTAVFPELASLASTREYRELGISCPDCQGGAVSCRTCNDLRLVCPRCRGKRWLRDNRFGSSVDQDVIACPDCMELEHEKNGPAYRLNLAGELNIIRGWIARWAYNNSWTVAPDATPAAPVPDAEIRTAPSPAVDTETDAEQNYIPF